MAMPCQQCGTLLEAGERFCNRCGTPVTPLPVGSPVATPMAPPPRPAANTYIRYILSWVSGFIATSVLCFLVWIASQRHAPPPVSKATPTPTPMVRNGIPSNAVAWLTADLVGLAPALGGDGKDPIEPWRHTHVWQALKDQLKALSVDLDADVIPWMGTRVSLIVIPGHERFPVLDLSVRDAAKAQDFVKAHFATWKPDAVQASILTGPDGGAVTLVDDQMFLGDSTAALSSVLDTWAGRQPSALAAVDASPPVVFAAEPIWLTRFLPAEAMQSAVTLGALPKAGTDLFEAVKSITGSMTAAHDGSAHLDVVLVPQDPDKHPLMQCLLQATPVVPGDAGRLLPSDTALYGVFDINNLRKLVETGAAYDEGTLKQLGDVVRDLKAKHIDVEKDVLDSLTGEVAWSSRLRAQGDDGAEHAVTECATHLREMANACEVYKIDHSVYPDSLLDLHPKYLAELPTCPASGSYKYQRSQDGDSFTLLCSGEAHKAAGCSSDKPSFDSVSGLDWGRPDGPLRTFLSQPTLIAVGVRDRTKLAAAVRTLLAGLPRQDSEHGAAKIVEFGGRALMAFADSDHYLLIGFGPVRSELEAALDAPPGASRFVLPGKDVVSAVYVDPTQLVKALGDSLPETALIDFLAPYRQVWVTTSAEAGNLHVRAAMSK